MTEEEHVVLVDDFNNVIGTTPKSGVHTLYTPLHRAFSAFLFNDKNELLLQQRSHLKKTWPLAWSNSCCGHPGLGESNVDAAYRRVRFELGGTIESIQEVSPYRYRFEKDGVVENEICPILLGRIKTELKVNPDEVESITWITWDGFLEEIQEQSDKYSPWCKEEALILNDLDVFKTFLQ